MQLNYYNRYINKNCLINLSLDYMYTVYRYLPIILVYVHIMCVYIFLMYIKIIIKVIIERLLTRYEILLNIMNVW